jgi:hypothetical protein
MLKGKSVLAGVGGAILLSVSMIVVSTGAAFAVPSCLGSNFPAVSGGESSLKVSCIVPVGTAAGATDTIVDYGQARWHSGAARVTAADGNYTTTAVVTSATGTFVAGDVNHQVTSSLPGIPVGAFIKTVTNATTVTLDVPTTVAATTAVLTIENSSARHATDVTRSATTLLTSATANFKSTDVGAIVTGTGIKPGTKISAVGISGVNTTATISQATNQAGTNGYLTINPVLQPASNRKISDAHSPAAVASTSIISATAGFTASDIGLAVVGVGAGWPATARIISVTSATTAVLSAAATLGTTANHAAVIGTPDFGAPTNGSVVSQLGAELQLNPTLVASSDDCANHTPEGFVIQGTWNNPAQFVAPSLTLGAAPSNSVGQIVYGNISASFAAYVVRTLTGTYKVVFPVIPTALAQCASTALASTFTYNPITVGQSLLVSGAAAPNTAVVRGYADFVGVTAPANTAGTVTIGTNAAVALTACPVSRNLNGPTTWVCGQG